MFYQIVKTICVRKKTKEELKRVMKSVPLHKKIEDKFKYETIIPELQRKKDILKEIHETFKPIDMNQMDQVN